MQKDADGRWESPRLEPIAPLQDAAKSEDSAGQVPAACVPASNDGHAERTACSASEAQFEATPLVDQEREVPMDCNEVRPLHVAEDFEDSQGLRNEMGTILEPAVSVEDMSSQDNDISKKTDDSPTAPLGTTQAQPSHLLVQAVKQVESEDPASEQVLADALSTTETDTETNDEAQVYNTDTDLGESREQRIAALHGAPHANGNGNLGAVVSGATTAIVSAIAAASTSSISSSGKDVLALVDGDSVGGTELPTSFRGTNLWNNLSAPHIIFIQYQLAVLGGLVCLILISWRRHGSMISVLYALPGEQPATSPSSPERST